MKSSLKISNFLKTLQRDLKKVNVEPKQYSKKTVYIENEKKKAQEMREKQWKDLERQKNVSCKMKVTLRIKTAEVDRTRSRI